MLSADNFVWKNVARTNRNLRIVAIVGLAIACLSLACTGRATYNLMFGPWPVTEDQLANMNPTKDLRYYVKIKTDGKLSPPVFEEYSISKDRNGVEQDRSLSFVFQVMLVKDKVLLVKSAHGLTGAEIAGGLQQIGGQIEPACIRRLEKEHPVLKGQFLPYVLYTDKFNAGNYFCLVPFLALLGVCVWKLKVLQARQIDPNKHSIIKCIRQYGEPREVAAVIENELKMSNGGKRHGVPGFWTQDWLLVTSIFDMTAARLDDLVWVYPKETKHSVNFIPTGSTWQLVLNFADGKSLPLSMDKENAYKLLKELNRRVPWALVGYSNELHGLWNKQSKAVIERVAKAREEVKSKSGHASAA